MTNPNPPPLPKGKLWVKGQSGNPSGLPKNSFAKLVRDSDGDRDKLRALIARLWNMALGAEVADSLLQKDAIDKLTKAFPGVVEFEVQEGATRKESLDTVLKALTVLASQEGTLETLKAVVEAEKALRDTDDDEEDKRSGTTIINYNVRPKLKPPKPVEP